MAAAGGRASREGTSSIAGPGLELGRSASRDCGRERLCELALCGDSTPSTRRLAALEAPEGRLLRASCSIGKCRGRWCGLLRAWRLNTVTIWVHPHVEQRALSDLQTPADRRPARRVSSRGARRLRAVRARCSGARAGRGLGAWLARRP